LAILSLGGGVADSSMAAIVIARSLASKRAKVVIADLAQSGSSIEMLLGMQPGPGFADLLAGTADFTKVIIRDPFSTAHLLRFGFERSNASMALLNQKTDAVLGALGNIYDVVIVHAGETSSRTAALVGKCQGALVLAPATRQKDVAKAMAALSPSGQIAVQFVMLESWSVSAAKISATA
jgi:MinD-like ATPase involved in chromosome partitioning or flagellar assembly